MPFKKAERRVRGAFVMVIINYILALIIPPIAVILIYVNHLKDVTKGLPLKQKFTEILMYIANLAKSDLKTLKNIIFQSLKIPMILFCILLVCLLIGIILKIMAIAARPSVPMYTFLLVMGLFIPVLPITFFGLILKLAYIEGLNRFPYLDTDSDSA